MSYLDADAGEVREPGWIKIGVDTGAGKTARPQSVTYGMRILGDVDLTFRTATGELVKSGKRLRVNLIVRGVQAPVCKPLLSVGEYTTMAGVTVLYGYLFHRGSNVAKKVDAWIDCWSKKNTNKMDRKERTNPRMEEIHNTTVVQLRAMRTTCTTSP